MTTLQKLGLLLVSLCLGACSSTLKKPFYWDVQKGAHKAFVVGTIHIGVEARELPRFILDDFQRSQAVALEVTREWTDKPEAAAAREQKKIIARFSENLTLKRRTSDYFSDDEWKRIVAKVRSLKLPDVDYTKIDYAPAKLIYMMIASKEKVWVTRDDYYSLKGATMDKTFYQRAVSDSKTIVRLDSRDVIDSECYEQIFVMALKTHLSIGASVAIRNTIEMIDVYREGNEAQVLRLMKFEPDTQSCLLKERNERWVNVIERSLIAHTPLFVAAGVAHFLGEGNVLELLSAKGYRVQRVLSREH